MAEAASQSMKAVVKREVSPLLGSFYGCMRGIGIRGYIMNHDSRTTDLFCSLGAKILGRLGTEEEVSEDREQQAMEYEFLE